MQGGPVLYIEDHDGLRASAEASIDAFSNGRYYVAEQAANLEQAFSALGRMAAGELQPLAIFLDGNLRSGLPTNNDAREVVNRFNELRLSAWIIGVSSENLFAAGIPVNVMIDKENLRFNKVIEILDQLPNPDPAISVTPTDIAGGFRVTPTR